MSEEDNKQSTFGNFMKEKNADKSENISTVKENKIKTALKEAKEKKEEEKKKELFEAKKNSVFKASRYNQSDMRKMQAKNLIILIPFVAVGAFVFIMLIFNGEKIVIGIFNWITKILNKNM